MNKYLDVCSSEFFRILSLPSVTLRGAVLYWRAKQIITRLGSCHLVYILFKKTQFKQQTWGSGGITASFSGSPGFNSQPGDRLLRRSLAHYQTDDRILLLYEIGQRPLFTYAFQLFICAIIQRWKSRSSRDFVLYHSAEHLFCTTVLSTCLVQQCSTLEIFFCNLNIQKSLVDLNFITELLIQYFYILQ
jgi:hypothetical protein